MNDLPWIKYTPHLMFIDTVAMTASGERAHRRLMDYIWINDGPPRNDNEVLKQISQTVSMDWGKTKLELLGKGWMVAGEYFLHRGAIASLNESKEVYVANQNRTAAANKLPLLTLSTTDPITGVRNIVTCNVTPHVTPHVTSGQEQGQEQGQVPGNDYLTLKLTLGGLQRGVSQILRGEWHWDNCKVPENSFTNASLLTVLRPFIGQILGGDVYPAWEAAIEISHKAVKDGLPNAIKNPAGYAISAWREQLAKKIK